MTEPKQFIAEGLRGKLTRDVEMRRHTTWRAGGRAERMYQPAGLDDLAVFLRALPKDEPLLIVGLGSNLLVRDGGWRGTVVLTHAALGELRLEPDGTVSPQGGGRGCKAAEAATTTLYAQAGVPGAKLARFAALHDLAGAEFFAGIPGTVGGMLAMNAGCYGSETWQKVLRVQVLTRSGQLLERMPDEYETGYRHVALKSPRACDASPLSQRGAGGDFHSGLGDEWFAAAWFRFVPGDGAASREKIKALLDKRIASQPLNLPNAGSVFRNPPGEYAARLIEQCGLKGLQIGGARVSEKHANFIVNTGSATAADIESLIDEVQAAVEAKTGIRLHPEVKIVGEAK